MLPCQHVLTLSSSDSAPCPGFAEIMNEHLSQRERSPIKPGERRASSRERFPSFDHNVLESYNTPVFTSPTTTSPNLNIPPARWNAKRTSLDQSTRRTTYHKPRKSVSEAIHQFRTRRGSVSDNAQELAEALKAPISWQLIVRPMISGWQAPLTGTRDSV